MKSLTFAVAIAGAAAACTFKGKTTDKSAEAPILNPVTARF